MTLTSKLITCSAYEILQTPVFASIFPESQSIKGAFLPPSEIEDNAKFGISFVLNIFIVFFFVKLYLILLHS